MSWHRTFGLFKAGASILRRHRPHLPGLHKRRLEGLGRGSEASLRLVPSSLAARHDVYEEISCNHGSRQRRPRLHLKPTGRANLLEAHAEHCVGLPSKPGDGLGFRCQFRFSDLANWSVACEDCIEQLLRGQVCYTLDSDPLHALHKPRFPWKLVAPLRNIPNPGNTINVFANWPKRVETNLHPSVIGGNQVCRELLQVACIHTEKACHPLERTIGQSQCWLGRCCREHHSDACQSTATRLDGHSVRWGQHRVWCLQNSRCSAWTPHRRNSPSGRNSNRDKQGKQSSQLPQRTDGEPPTAC
mmetsp:Transcript_61555/g.156388  ORF Transcript_61555/g.156388 Transcript_61555/m.156388 type:complete len:301 (+) Transcript_61555:87-989(+)